MPQRSVSEVFAIVSGGANDRADDANDSATPALDRSTVEAVDDVIDVVTVARLMKVGRNTVYAMVGRNQIPHRRLGRQIRFHREAVMRWLASWSWQGAKEGH